MVLEIKSSAFSPRIREIICDKEIDLDRTGTINNRTEAKTAIDAIESNLYSYEGQDKNKAIKVLTNYLMQLGLTPTNEDKLRNLLSEFRKLNVPENGWLINGAPSLQQNSPTENQSKIPEKIYKMIVNLLKQEGFENLTDDSIVANSLLAYLHVNGANFYDYKFTFDKEVRNTIVKALENKVQHPSKN